MPKPHSIRAAFLFLSFAALACGRRSSNTPQIPTVDVRRQTVAVTASADGVVEPIVKVEVKSKASGEVTSMNADTGDVVKEGQVLLQLLPRDAQNTYDQAAADLESAKARADNARIQLERTRNLAKDGLVPSTDLESAQLQATTARSDVVRTQKALDTAAERLSETTVRSPISGTVIGRNIEVGQVISSAVSQVSGGTLLMTLADLNEVQVRSLVDEVDIGRIRAGLPVSIKVQAYPDHPFSGTVLKIEPQAVVQQNVTMFPVLTRIDNRESLLKPGMNAEVEISIESHENVLAVPNEAIKSREEAMLVARYLGVDTGAGASGQSERWSRRQGSDSSGTAMAATQRPESPPASSGPRAGGPAGSGTGAGGGGGKVVFLVKPGNKPGYTLAPVETGLRNWEVTEVTSGLQEGDRVALAPSGAQLRQSADFRERMQRMRGLPGQNQGGQQRPRGN
jgi:HlyD family secretion protein